MDFCRPKLFFFDFEKKKFKFFFQNFVDEKYCRAITKSEWHTPKSNFGQFLAKMAKTVKIIKKALGTFLSRLQALTKCKVSEKSKERFPRKSVTYVRTHVRTHVRTNGRDS